MSPTDRPGRHDPLLSGLELWLSGTPAELDAAARILAGIGRVVAASPRHRLTGADAGRWRVYARIAVASPAAPCPPAPAEEPATLPDLAA